MAISFDFNATMRQVTEMKQIASEMRSIADRDMQNTISQLKTNWKGDSSNKFCSKYDILRGRIRTEASNIDTAANTLYSLAQSIKAAEERAEALLAQKNAAEAAAKANK